LVNPIAITPILGRPDCQHGGRYGTSTHDRGCQKIFVDQMNYRYADLL
jgi:hypothetical protein